MVDKSQNLGVGTYGQGLKHVVQSSPVGLNWLDFTTIVEVGAEVQAGEFVTSAGETAGDPMVLTEPGDDDTGAIYLVIERVGAPPQDIDAAIPANGFARVMRGTGKKFEVACYRYDSSAAILKGQKMCLHSVGHLMEQVYVQSTEATDMHRFLVETSRDDADPASGSSVIYIWY